ncbi:MAG: FAD-dependent oxidoreductase [Hyphomicrobiales bacterium]|nr:FAD-dependent oxidoreductase [Hyphomicrobiales bacterium]
MIVRAKKTGRPMVVVGAGQGGIQAAESLKEEGWEGEIVLYGDEPHPPYHRPPLSKDALLETLDFSTILLRGPDEIAAKGIDFRPGVHALRIDREHRIVELDDGSIQPYEGLVIATGGFNRRLPIPGGDLPDISSLRSIDDAYKFAENLGKAETVLVVGAGFVGLEIAAVCRQCEKEVTVIERESRVLARAVSPVMSEFYQKLHRDRGVVIELNTSVTEVLATDGRATGLKLGDGRILEADLIVAGIGLVPNDRIARECGLPCEHGVIVDRCSRTIDPNIVAVGDCTATAHEPGQPLHRLESVQNAVEQAKSGAAALMGREAPFLAAPWFWSDQYDIKLRAVGRTADHDRVVIRGDMDAPRFSAFYFKEGRFLGADSVNAVQDHSAARRILDAGLPLTPEEAGDPGFALGKRSKEKPVVPA